MENPDLVLQETGSRPTYSRLNYVPSGDTLRRDAISSLLVQYFSQYQNMDTQIWVNNHKMESMELSLLTEKLHQSGFFQTILFRYLVKRDVLVKELVDFFSYREQLFSFLVLIDYTNSSISRTFLNFQM